MTLESRFLIGQKVTFADAAKASKRGVGIVKGVMVAMIDGRRDASVFVEFKSIGLKWLHEDKLVKA